MSASAPTYAFATRALQRWRDERLALTENADGTTSATFRFEGSTCGNVPLALVYRVRVAPAASEWRLLELSCTPAEFDSGHTRMCSYLENPDRILRTLLTEVPLLGEPLAAALDWHPLTLPAGCVCSSRSRAHKWLAVLHTLHFTLSQRPPATH